MRKLAFALMVLAVSSAWAALNATDTNAAVEAAAVQGALTMAVVELMAGLFFFGAGLGAYLFKLKDQHPVENMWLAVAAICLLLGLVLFVWGLFGLVAYLTAPIVLG